MTIKEVTVQETFEEYGDKLIRLGTLMKDQDAKLRDIVEAAFEAGLIVRFGLEPDPKNSAEVVIDPVEEA